MAFSDYSFAPMEGITVYTFRQVFNKYYGGVDRYYTPFINPNTGKALDKKAVREILPENNKGIKLIPQILTNDSRLFLEAAKEIREYGYDTVNLNLGCPSKTVSSKGRGSGFLRKREDLDRFFKDIFEKTDMKISVKTRIGYASEDEFTELLDIYAKYPIDELIIHPRLQSDYYSGNVRYDAFRTAAERYRGLRGKESIPENGPGVTACGTDTRLCFNGDICDVNDAARVSGMFPDVKSVMIGRGFLKNPELMQDIAGKSTSDKKRLRQFADEMLEEYRHELDDDRLSLFKMKEIWTYLAERFDSSDKQKKAIMKSSRLSEYNDAVTLIFMQCELKEKE